jgi:hypothetical protein
MEKTLNVLAKSKILSRSNLGDDPLNFGNGGGERETNRRLWGNVNIQHLPSTWSEEGNTSFEGFCANLKYNFKFAQI